MQWKTEITWSDDIEAAPRGCRLLCITINGVNFLVRDSIGEWRNYSGRPKAVPKLWAIAPEDPRK